jgi:hypothetical protein
MTPFEKQCDILAELWLNYRDDENFSDFIEYNDVGMPLSYLSHSKLAIATDEGKMMIGETWSVLLESLSLTDTGFDSLEDLLG